MEIREIKDEDFEQVLEIIFRYKRDNGLEIPPEKRPAMLATMKSLIGRTESTTLVAVEGELVLGYANAHCCPFPTLGGVEWYVTELFVNHDYRGRGTGGALLTELEERARRAGGVRLMLNNFKAIESYDRSFYAKKGFTERVGIANFVKPF